MDDRGRLADEDGRSLLRCRLSDLTVTSSIHDIDVPGLRKAERISLHLFDLDSVDESIIHDGIEFDKEDIRRGLTLFLYPDDSDEKGTASRIYSAVFSW